MYMKHTDSHQHNSMFVSRSIYWFFKSFPQSKACYELLADNQASSWRVLSQSHFGVT